jgi:phenylalanyl-tRNA synthetase beta chain
LAVRLTLGRQAEALTDADIDAAMQAVIAALAEQLGAKLRG